MLAFHPGRLFLPLVFCVVIGDRALSADFLAIAADAQAGFEPITEDEVDTARAALADQAAALTRRLNPETGFGAGWLDYLRWSGVAAQLTPGAEADLSAAQRTLNALASGAEGLESPVFQRTAEKLEQYAGLARFFGSENQTRSFQRVTQAVAELLTSGDVSDPRVSFNVERRLGLLQRAGLASELTSAVDGVHGMPNVYLKVESTLLSRLVDQMVSDCGPVEDCILGTRIRGTGFTSGMLSVSTLPATDRARLAFALTGTTDSRTRGVNGPVAIYSTGRTAFTAHKIVELDDRSFRLMPTSASATTRTKTNNVEKIGGGLFSGLIERIAADRVAEKKPRADAIAADHAEDRIERRLDDQLVEKIHDARRAYDDRLTKPLRRRRASPRRVVQRTTSDSLVVELVQASGGQLAASGPPPAAADGELTARIHQSAANNLMAAYLGGATLRRESQEERVELVGRETPEWLLQDDDEPTLAPREDVDFEPYRLRLRSVRPVSFAIEGGLLRATVHVARLEVEGDTYEGWDVTLVFKPEVIEDRWKLVRQGEVEVIPTRFDPSSDESLSSKQVALRGNLAKALNDPPDRLPREVRIDPIDPGSEAPIDLLAIQDLRFEDGWAIVSWRSE